VLSGKGLSRENVPPPARRRRGREKRIEKTLFRQEESSHGGEKGTGKTV